MKRFLFLIVWFFFACNAAQAAITAQIDPPKAQIGETLRLTILMENVQSGDILNLTPLEQDFSIISTERSMSYSMINGQSKSASQWTVYLAAKKTGTLKIPPLKIGREQTQALQIEITQEPTPSSATQSTQSTQPTATNAEDVMLKTEISQEKPWINQQVLYTVKLYNSNQRLLDAEYKPPHIENALLVPLGDGHSYQSQENGRTYNVEEQQYAIFPQKSGQLELIAPSLQALIFDAVPRRVHVQGKNIQLNVQPMPTQHSGKYWLPAKQFKLSEEYDKKGNAIHEGSTVVRTITMEGIGVPAQLLPALTFENGEKFNTYPEKPEVKNVIHGQDLVGTSTLKITYLFNEQGVVTIPALQVPWFNTITGKEEIAELPAYRLTVTPKAGSAPAQATTEPEASRHEKSKGSSELPVVTSASTTDSNLFWGLAIGFAFAWFLVVIIRWIKPAYFLNNKLRKAKKKLKKACSENDPAQARSALLQWASAQWPDEDLLNLNDLARWIHNVQIKKQLHLLSQALYSQHKKTNWQGRDLWSAMNSYRHKTASKTYRVKDLPPINP
jgi:hypothetical protein